MKMIKKILSLLSALCLLMNVLVAGATGNNTEIKSDFLLVEREKQKEEIMRNYYADSAQLNIANTLTRASEDSGIEDKVDLQNHTVEKLISIGYNAYSITEDNYEEIQSELQTDLSELGISKGTNAIITIGGYDVTNSSRSNNIGTFYYTYDGTTYRMRILEVTAADLSVFYQKDEVELLNSSSHELISYCLDSMISAGLDSMCTGMGTVLAMCGVTSEMIGSTAPCDMELNCIANWSRYYTQIYEAQSDEWISGSSVDKVYCRSYIVGDYYSTITNESESFDRNEIECYLYSEYYNSVNWCNTEAVLGYRSGLVNSDKIYRVPFYYNDDLVITLNCQW